MAHCEDFPCCGHELGCCPDYDPETGRQLNMKCVCGATVPLDSRFSICEGCMRPDPYDCSPDEYERYYGSPDEWDDDNCNDDDEEDYDDDEG